MNRYYIGLSTSGHDPALAMVDEEGRLLFAEGTERFLQCKRAWGAAPDHPMLVEKLLKEHCDPNAEFVVATSWARLKGDTPTQVMDALLPASEGVWLRNQHERAHRHAGDSVALLQGQTALPRRLDFEHHLCHATFACQASPFDDAICLVLDGEGDVGAVSLYRWNGGRPKRIWRSWGPGSLGAFYGWLTGACGFDWKAGEEWKVMGLAGFGTPVPPLQDIMSQLLRTEQGRLFLADPEVVHAALQQLRPYSRNTDTPPLEAADLAASGQQVYAAWADSILEACTGYGSRNLVLTGGCALNSSYNGTIARRHEFERVFVPCAPGDDGNAVGAALLAWLEDHRDRPLPAHNPTGTAGSPFLGSRISARSIQSAVQNAGPLRVTEVGEDGPKRLAHLLAQGRIVGVCRGAAEFGPRALGHRSILADPRPADMKDRINHTIKGREPYRPLAPMVPGHRTSEWFHHAQPSPYMSFTLPWREAMHHRVPAVVHKDGTGRLQTVEPNAEPWLDELLTRFEALTSLPVLLNTSFNVMGKPIAHCVEDALAVLMSTGLDAVMFDSALIEKNFSSAHRLDT